MFNSQALAAALVTLTLACSSAVAAQELADPMRPPGTITGTAVTKSTPSDESAFRLSAIRIGKSQRSATINGKNVTIGDRVGTARVVSIQASRVTLRKAGTTMTISLLPISIKKPVEATRP